MEESSVAAPVVVDAEELPNEMISSSSSSSSRSASSCLRLRRFDETENEQECKQRLLKQLQGSSCRSLGHENDNNWDEDVDGSASSQSNTRSKLFWFRRSSSSDEGASSSRRVIKRHCSWEEGTMNSNRMASTSNAQETAPLDDSSTVPEPVLIGSSKNSVFFSMRGDRGERIKHKSSRKSTSADHGTGIMAVSDMKQIPQEPNCDLGPKFSSMEDYDNDHCSIDPDMPPAHVHRLMASSSPPMHYQYQKPESQQQRPPVLQCSFGIKAGGSGGPIFPSPSPTDSNVTRSDDDDDDLEEDLRQLSFCPIPLVDESSLAALPPTPPPPPMMDRWSPSPPLTVKMFGSEPPKLPTRGGRRHLAHEEEELLSYPLSPPRLPARRPKMAENEMLASANHPATSAIPQSPPPPLSLGSVVSRLGGSSGCPLSKPIARTAVPLPQGTCSKLLCDSGGIVAPQKVAAATSPSAGRATTMTSAKEEEDDDDDGDGDSYVFPLISDSMSEYAPASPHQQGYGYHHHGIQEKNNIVALWGKRRGILKDDGHDKGIREGAFSHGAPRLRNEEYEKKKRNVTFGRIHIREYERVLGDNPSCSCGPPISLGWMHWDLYDSTLDAYESSQKSRPASTPPHRGKRDFYLSPSRRCELILHEWQSCPREAKVRRAQCEDGALVHYRREKSIVASQSKNSLPQTVAALSCKPSVDDSDTSQPPTSPHGRGGGGKGGGPPTIITAATTTAATSPKHNDDAESVMGDGSEV